MRIRTIKPEFWPSEKLAKASREARLLFVGLWSMADDSGRINLSWSDYDGGTTGLGSISVRMTWRNGFIYLPHCWMPVTESGVIYYAVTRASGTGTVTGYVDCWGGALWV